MTLREACEPLFQWVCRLNRAARKGVEIEASAARAEAKSLLELVSGRAGASFAAIEPVLLYFVDFTARSGAIKHPADWQDLAAEKGLIGGDEDFFDRLDEALRDTSPGAADRLAVFYICVGLGFSGWYAGQHDYLRRRMRELAPRIAEQIDADLAGKVCPDAYAHTDTSELFQPPARRLVGVGIVLAGLAATVVLANIAAYIQKRDELRSSLSALADSQPENARPAQATPVTTSAAPSPPASTNQTPTEGRR